MNNDKWVDTGRKKRRTERLYPKGITVGSLGFYNPLNLLSNYTQDKNTTRLSFKG